MNMLWKKSKIMIGINNANIKIEYDYYFNNLNGTIDNTADDVIEINSKTLTLNFNGVIFNTLKNEGANNDIYQQIQFGQSNIPSKKSYLNGNGYFSMIKLFDELDSQNQLLMNLRRNRWLVSEANLYLYVDQDFYISQNVDPVERLYLFNYKIILLRVS